MIYLAALLAVFFFILTLETLRVVQVSAQAIRISRSAVETMRDLTLSDEDKERGAS